MSQSILNVSVYNDYDYLELVLKGELDKLNISELEKYLEKNKLSMKGKKYDKVRAITADVLRKMWIVPLNNSQSRTVLAKHKILNLLKRTTAAAVMKATVMVTLLSMKLRVFHLLHGHVMDNMRDFGIYLP